MSDMAAIPSLVRRLGGGFEETFAPPPAAVIAFVWSTQARGSMGRTGSCRERTKPPGRGLGSQHLATTSVIGLQKEKGFINK